MSSENRLIKSEQLRDILKNEPKWYKDKKLAGFFDYFSPKGPVASARSQDWPYEMRELFNNFMNALENRGVLLGKRREFFNDDDRQPITTVVIHHTVSNPDASYAFLNAFDLLRLYVPLWKDGVFGKGAISSGHSYNKRESFIGYHFLVREDGSYEQILKDEHTGFHAGDYPTNCRSIGVAIAGDFTNKPPSEAAINSVAKISKSYNPSIVLGHGEVIITKTGKRVDTECPGKTFYGPNGLKENLLNKIAA